MIRTVQKVENQMRISRSTRKIRRHFFRDDRKPSVTQNLSEIMLEVSPSFYYLFLWVK